MPRAKKLKPLGENGAINLTAIAAALRDAIDLWPPNHYTSDIGHRCSLAECLAALGAPEECDALIARGRQDCWHGNRFRGRYAVAIQLIERSFSSAKTSQFENAPNIQYAITQRTPPK